MVVGQVTLDQLMERLTPLERTLGRPVNPTVYSSEEMRAKLKAGNHFLKAIQKGKNTFLIGDEHEFRKLLLRTAGSRRRRRVRRRSRINWASSPAV